MREETEDAVGAAPEQGQVIETFLASLDRLDVEWTRAASHDFSEVLAALLVEPAVGAPLPFDGLSMEELPIILNPTAADLEAARTGVTAARLGIADYGSLVLQGGPDSTEAASLFPELHVAVLQASDVVPDMAAAFERLARTARDGHSAILATGPSATADMGALVRGAHGPKRVHVILVEDR